MTNLTAFPGSLDNPFDLAEPAWDTTFSDPIDQEVASATWRAAVADMRVAGTISHAQATQLRRYAWFVVQFESAMRQIDSLGVVGQAKRSKVLMTNPLWTIAHQADARALEHEAELGLSPRRRSTATAAKRRKSAGAADTYLGTKKA